MLVIEHNHADACLNSVPRTFCVQLLETYITKYQENLQQE